MHNNISLIRFVIPGLTRNPVFFWIPALAGMTAVGDSENGPKNNNGRSFIDSHLIIPFIPREREK